MRRQKGYTHLNIYERKVIENSRTMGWSIRRIAEFIERSPSTVSRELERNTAIHGVYLSAEAHDLARARNRLYGAHRNPKRGLIYPPRCQYGKILRTHVAWYSDTEVYIRIRTNWPSAFFRTRATSIFKLDDKPYHYSETVELFSLLAEHNRWRKLIRLLKSKYPKNMDAEPAQNTGLCKVVPIPEPQKSLAKAG
ncbi:hypothetical protein FUAX_07300 [Fulvitalea axinellae]|uniref:Transposase IS30-like HTH domain-containing protein n=1 Tax=Fulvitalea axinellae TaxID=1182444 RepID=A0AAU9CJX9_9BACT|nr:hypothetical protein FUAX_07300 [Fulvitalea axinellae]